MLKKIMFSTFFIVLFGSSVLYTTPNFELSGLMKPQTLTVAKDRLYITEDTSIYIYSLKDYKLIKKIGKKGEGPGEFRDGGFGIRLEIDTGRLIVYSQGRISYFTIDGKFIKERQVTDPRKMQFQKLGNKYVGTTISRSKNKVYFSLNIYNSNLKINKEIYKYEHPFYPTSKKINPLNPRVCSYFVYEDKIIFDDLSGNINFFNSNGEKIKTISPPYEKIMVNNIIKKRYTDIWKINLKPEYDAFKTRFEFPAQSPKIRNFHIIDNKIYILTYKQKGEKNEMLVYSFDGKLIKRTFVPLIYLDMLLPNLYNYYAVKNGLLYKLIEDPDTETWKLQITIID